MYYLFTINKYLGQRSLFTQEELNDADDLEHHWLSTQKKPTFYELLNIFPEAKPSIKRNLLATIKQTKQDLTEADTIRIRFNNATARVLYEDRWFYTMLRDIVYVNPLKEGRERLIKRCYFQLSALKPVAKEVKGKITDREIAQAKAVPIESLYSGTLCKKGKTLVGKCELHRERTGSFTIYTRDNRWWCYGENIGGDAIDYIMKRDGIKFLEAVKKLI